MAGKPQRQVLEYLQRRGTEFPRLSYKPDWTTGCWNWLGEKDVRGYGGRRWNGRAHRAYRVFYEELVGPIPEGLCLDHLCRNPSCVNPMHLEPVTLKENWSRGISPQAINARKTHCLRGHNDWRVWARPKGGTQRVCRSCRAIENARQYQRRKLRKSQ